LRESLILNDAPAIYEQLKELVTGFVPDAEIVDFYNIKK
jgi:hypothetical protein